MPKLTAQQMKAVDDYSKSITTLADTVTAIRKVPGMYIAGIGSTGYLSMMREVYQNSVDQMLKPNSPCRTIWVWYDMRTLEFTVKDNGLGFPFEDMIRMVTEQHTSSNFVKTKGSYPSGLHGTGLKAVNALSSECHISSYKYDGSAKRIDLVEGYLKKGPYDIKNKDKYQGSIVSFRPCSLMGKIDLDWIVVYNLIKDILSLTPLGCEVYFEAIDLNSVKHEEHIVNKDGIITRLISTVTDPIIKPIVVYHDTGVMRINTAFTFQISEDNNNQQVTAYCNKCPTIAGPHITGTIDGIAKWFTSYMNNIVLANQNKKSKIQVTNADIKSALRIMIAADCLEPIFIGQAKEQLSNVEMGPFCRDALKNALDEWSKANPQDLLKLTKVFKEIAIQRSKNDESLKNIAQKYVANPISGFPSKFIKPTKVFDEFYIVEGDSAGGTAKDARDSETQGIMKTKGKIPNAFEKTPQGFFSNEEVQGIWKIILNGKDYKRSFDPFKDVPWNKVILSADADVDGAHICTLHLNNFIKYGPQLIEAGKIYKVIPPLYGIVNGKKVKYITDAVDFVLYVQNNFTSKNEVAIKGKKLSNKDLTYLFTLNEDYVRILESMANTYAVNPRLLELALLGYKNNTNLATIKKNLKSEFRFMDVQNIKKNIVYDGTIEESNFLPMSDKLATDCSQVLQILDKNENFQFKLNGRDASLYDVMKAFDKSYPSNIQRYKGLGEMNTDQLRESVMNRNNRTLIQYTFENISQEIDTIRKIESDKSKLLNFIGNIKKSDLME